MRLPHDIVAALQATEKRIFSIFAPQGWQYEIISEQEKTSKPTHSLPSRLKHFFSSLTTHKHLLSTVTVLTLLATIFYTSTSWNPRVEWQPNRHQNHKMKFLMPSAVSDGDSCKTLTSAIALGYPVPEIVNYNITLEDAGRESDRERSKIKLLSDYFTKISTSSDNDVAVVLDTPSTWVQLRPEVLLRRYFALNHAANVQLRKLHSYEDITTRGVGQRTILSGGHPS